jgi:hypothetical protein
VFEIEEKKWQLSLFFIDNLKDAEGLTALTPDRIRRQWAYHHSQSFHFGKT